MPTKTKGPQAHINFLTGNLKEVESLLFDPLIDQALRHLIKTFPREYSFSVNELLTKRKRLLQSSKKRINLTEKVK